MADDESALISKYEQRLDPPEDIKTEMATWEDMRRYVHTDSMLRDVEDAVGTNFILRNQQAMMALVRVRDAAPRVRPRKWLPGPDGSTYPQELLDYARTHEIVAEYQQRKGRLLSILNGAVADAMTVPFTWIKMRNREDYDLDALGYTRADDREDTVKRYERLRQDFDDGMFAEDDAEHKEMLRLNDLLRDEVMEDMQREWEEGSEILTDEFGEPLLDEFGEPERVGDEAILSALNRLQDGGLIDLDYLPEVAHYRGFTWQQVDPEDIRWDWSIKRPEDISFARWMGHRSWMTEAEIRERWRQVDDEWFQGAIRQNASHTPASHGSANTGDDSEYGGKDPEERTHASTGEAESRRGDKLAVWEYWDRVQGRVFRWVQGTKQMLDSYRPSNPPSRFFPFYLVMLNRVSGRFFGPSDAELQQALQQENNRQRTWEREAQRASQPRYIVPKGLLRPAEKAKLENAEPYAVVEIERADDVAKMIVPITPQQHNPGLYERNATLREMQQMAGLPSAALGAGAGTGLATDSAIANEQMGNQVDDRRWQLQALLADIYEAMSEINAQSLPQENVMEIAGPGAIWPDADLQQMLANFSFDAECVIDDAAARQREMKSWVDIAHIAGAMGLPLNPIAVTQRLMTLMDVRDNLGDYISIPALMGGQQPTEPGGSAPRPEDQGPAGAQGGRPQGDGFSAPPSPASVPNAPS